MKLSIVAPVYNEEQSIAEFATQLKKVLDPMNITYEVILVNDGSSDKTLEVLQGISWKQLKIISFISNAGQVSGLDAGYRASKGDYVITMDSDLQHPPEMIPALLKKIVDENLDVVYGTRPDRGEESWFKRTSAKMYYKTIRYLSDVNIEESASEYRIVSKRVVDTMRLLPPGKRMIRLLIAGFNFPSGTMPYVAAERFAGETKYTLKRMLSFATNSILGFSTKPLRLSIYVGFFFSFLSLLGFAQALWALFATQSIPGWTSIMASMFMLFGVMFIMIGVLGAYIGKIMEHISGRQDYIIDEKNSRL